jgi:hypothetical protein
MGRSVRRGILCVMLAGSAIVVPATAASAHVHGITPLDECSVVPDNAGAEQTDEVTGAARDLINGLIPITVGAAQEIPGDGGDDAPVQCP